MPPKIPGFYFDETRKRYFLVSNGDQRFHSAYSNNALQQSSRREAYHESSKRRRPQSPEYSGQAARMARQNAAFVMAAMHRAGYLPHGPPPPLDAFRTLRPFADCRIAPGPTNEHVYVVRGGGIELVRAEAFLHDPTSAPLCTIPVRPVPRTRRLEAPSQLALSGSASFLFVFRGSEFWLWRLAGSYTRADDWSDKLRASVRPFMPPGSGDEENEPVVGSISDGVLHLAVSGAPSVAVNLKSFAARTSSRKASPRFETRTVHKASGPTWLYSVGKRLVSGASHDWKFKLPVYDFFFQEAPKLEGHRALYVVTRDQIITCHFDPVTMHITSRSSIAIHNDNQARPLVQLVGTHLVVEESKDTYKVFDTQNITTKTLQIKGAPGRRGLSPSIVSVGSRLFWTADNKTMVFSGADTVPIGDLQHK